MSIQTAAEYLDYKRPMVEELIKQGAFPAKSLRPGGDRRIRREDIDTYLRTVFEGKAA